VNILKKRKGKAIVAESPPSKATKKKIAVGPARGWSKVTIPATKRKSNKRKEVLKNDSDYDVEQDVLDIVSPVKKITVGGNKVHINVPETPIDNVSFHHVANALKWKYVYQRRPTLERKMGRGALECKQVMCNSPIFKT